MNCHGMNLDEYIYLANKYEYSAPDPLSQGKQEQGKTGYTVQKMAEVWKLLGADQRVTEERRSSPYQAFSQHAISVV